MKKQRKKIKFLLKNEKGKTEKRPASLPRGWPNSLIKRSFQGKQRKIDGSFPFFHAFPPPFFFFFLN